MKTAPQAVGPISVVMLGLGMILARSSLAQEAPPPESYIKPTPDRVCDEFNRSWKVTNTHGYLSIKVTVRWHAVGARQMQEEFILAPSQVRAIGCAPNIEVVSAEILQF